jgi:hypothetical protein
MSWQASQQIAEGHGADRDYRREAGHEGHGVAAAQPVPELEPVGTRSLEMANGNGDPRTKAELLDEIDRLQDQVDDLEDALGAISDIASGGAPEEEDEDEDGGAYDSD